MQNTQHIVIAGGSGVLGTALTDFFRTKKGYRISVLSRRTGSQSDVSLVKWDGIHLGDWTATLDGADILINLSGRSVDCRYTAHNRKAIMESRIQSTRALGHALQHCSRPPPVWINASTATIYEHTYGTPHTESSSRICGTPEVKDEFSVEVAKAWEAAVAEIALPSVRKIVLRTGLVFGTHPDGVYSVLRRLAQVGLGGTMGHGKQYISWIHEADFCRAISWLIEQRNAVGVYNLCAPEPLPNSEVMRALRDEIRIPYGIAAPRALLEIGAVFLRTETELILKSRRVISEKLVQEGFSFLYPTIYEAFAELEERRSSRRHAA